MLTKLLNRKPKREPVTHSFLNRYWGHNYNILKYENEGKKLRAAGWKTGIREGDYLILQRPEAKEQGVRYRVKEIEYKLDPYDMWFATLIFDPSEGYDYAD